MKTRTHMLAPLLFPLNLSAIKRVGTFILSATRRLRELMGIRIIRVYQLRPHTVRTRIETKYK